MYTDSELVFSINKFLRFCYFEVGHATLHQQIPDDSWLFLYVDRGKATLRFQGHDYQLDEGFAMFLPLHSQIQKEDFLSVAEQAFANLYIINFQLTAGSLAPYCNQMIRLSPNLTAYVKLLLKEAKFCFQNDLRQVEYSPLVLRENRPFGSEQMLKNLMEQFLISLVREAHSKAGKIYFELTRETLIMDNLNKNPYFDGIIHYLENHIGENLTIKQICDDNLTNRSKLQRTFHACTGEGVIAYHQKMKIEYAKILIREGVMNFTQISELLAYSSLHHFSKKFKQLTYMTPSSYRRMVR